MKSLALFAVLVLLGGGLANNATAESPEPDLSNITAPAAAAQARESNQAVPVTAEYTKTTQVFAQPDGTFTAEIASGPVQIPSEETATGWEDIDTTLADTGGIVEPAAAAAVIEFSDGGDAELASLATGTRQFGMDWTSTLPAPSLAGDTATYADVLPGIDLTLQARPQGFEQNLVVAEPPTEPIVVQLPLELKGLSATVDADGQMVMTDSTGKPVIAADPARMWGAEIDPANDEPTVQAYVDTRVVNTPTGPKLEIAPDPSFFTQPGLTYPVTVDPAPDLAVDKDTYVDSSQPGQFFRNDVYLKTGSPDGSAKTRSYLKFGVGTLAGKYINSATMKLFTTFSASCPNETTVHVFEANSPGIQTDTTWNNQLGQGDRYASKTFAAGCGGSNGATVGFDDGGYSGKTMRDLVQKWANNTSANYGVRLEAQNETSSSGYKKYKSSESANNVPVLSVNYSFSPTAPSGLSVTGANTYQPTLHGTFHDPDGGSGQVLYTITDQGSGSAVLTDAAGAVVTSGSNSPLAIPAGTLTDNKTYTWTARGFDGTSHSAVVSGGSFTWDNDPQQPMLPSPLMGYLVTEDTTEFSAMYLHPGSVDGKVNYEVYDSEACSGSPAASGNGSVVADGEPSIWPASGLSLDPGESFGVRAKAIQQSDNDESAWTSCASFDYLIGLSDPQPTGAVSTATPTLSVEISDDAPGAVAADFVVKNYTTGAVVASGQGSSANPGARSQWTVPSNTLSASTVYTWEASGDRVSGTQAEKIVYFSGSQAAAVVTEPISGADVSGFEMSVAAEASGINVTSVDFIVDGQTESVLVDEYSIMSGVVSTPGLGSHTIKARVHGTVNGQTTYVDSATVSFDTVVDYQGLEDSQALLNAPEAAEARPVAEIEEGEGPVVRSPLTPFKDRMADYAEEWWNGRNPNYIDYGKGTSGGDCANFVSQILFKGGLRYVNPGADKYSAANWWYDRGANDGTSDDDNSLTWSVSESLRHAAFEGALDPATRLRTGAWRTSLKHARVGDIIFVDMLDDDEEDSNHTLFVTAVRDENVYVNYHSSNNRRRPIFPVSPGDYRYDLYHGNSFIQAVNASDETTGTICTMATRSSRLSTPPTTTTSERCGSTQRPIPPDRRRTRKAHPE